MRELERVLLVDDDPDLRAIGELSLSSVGGLDVRCAASGVDALTMANADRPDVVLLDLMMPGLDGLATLAKLKEDPATRDIPVIFLSAKVGAHELEHYRELGAKGILQKPFDPMTLPDEVRRIIRGTD